MNKPSFIGFFLALAFALTSIGSQDYRNFGWHLTLFFSENNRLVASSLNTEPPYPLSLQLSSGNLTFIKSAAQNEKAAANEKIDARDLVLWTTLVIALLIFSFYFLVQTKQKQVRNETMNTLRAELMVLFNDAPCGYHSVDAQGVIININNTLLKWLGYERQEVIGKIRFSDMVEGEYDGFREATASAVKSGLVKTEIILKTRSGERFPVILGVVNTGDANRDLTRRLFTTIDNSTCYEARERIKNLDQELEAFSYSISHDLRAPLRSIDGYSKILQEDYAALLGDEGKRVLNVVMSNARRMGRLIDDLLDFGRLGRAPMQVSNVNMTFMVNGIVRELLAKIPERKVDIRVDELLPVSADADMIRQAWFNLIENAIKYTGKNEHATIDIQSYRLGNTELCYKVKDNGVGFDMQYSGKIFGVFQRLHKMQDFTGTGVGLAIVKRIISRHGGRVWAEASLDGGATFYFTLPTEHGI